ncbi:M28 family metallopeptidase [Phenylobacterium terrae]|uniref:M28 family metallopeptidase n=1 Tax=Phenylobacterium terrae TaxID=2665495 RepID=A0ABW4MYZ4_9CAUL
MRTVSLALILALAAQAAAAQTIAPDRLKAHVETLASDAFEGRAPATPGETKTVDYLVGQFKAAGVKPGGKLKGGARSWTQDVPLAQFDISGPVSVRVSASGDLAWEQGREVALRASQLTSQVDIQDAPIVFVGYGVHAPERNWDDFKGVDLKGKIALALVNDPDFETGQGDFGGKAMTWYGRWPYKYEEAAKQGALGLLVIHETAPASYGWETVKNSNTNTIIDVIRDKPGEVHPVLEGWIQRDAAAELMRRSGHDFEALKRAAQSRDFRPVPLNAKASVSFPVKAQKIVSRNVIGLVEGRSRPDEVVLYTGHWDHLGVALPDATGDAIYNGAVDNATGIAALLEIARAFAAGPAPARSVAFLAVTAEEKGLIGSEYYASNPIYPLATTVGVINMDALKPVGPASDFTTSGNAPVTLQDELIALATTRGRTYSPDPRPEAGSFFRSDHFPFAKRGVPAISFGSGQTLVEGGAEAGSAWSRAYTAERYHQPSDELSPDWRFDGIAADAELLYALGRRLADSDIWPEWKAGSEFKAVREASEAERR